MADSFIGIDEPTTIDKKADTEQLVVGANTVERERVQIAGTTATGIAGVDAANGLDVDVTRLPALVAGAANIGDVDIASPLGAGTEAAAVRVTLATDSTGLVSVDDNGANLSVDWNGVAPPIGAGTEAAALRVTVATDSTGVLSVDDNAGSLTVDGTVTSNQGTPAATANRWPVQITDGTDLALVSAAGAVIVDGSAVTQPVSGTVTAAQTTASSLNAEVQGDAAHNAALSGNPVRAGGRAQATQIAAVTDGVTTDLVTDRHGQLHTRSGHETHAASVFTNVNFPAVNTRATSTRAAGAAGVRHVCTGLTASLAAGTTAPSAVQLDVRVRDGIADTGTILWQMVISLPATAGAMNGVTRSGLWIPGTAATAMTMEFSAAGGANTFESVSMEIVDITE